MNDHLPLLPPDPDMIEKIRAHLPAPRPDDDMLSRLQALGENYRRVLARQTGIITDLADVIEMILLDPAVVESKEFRVAATATIANVRKTYGVK